MNNLTSKFSYAMLVKALEYRTCKQVIPIPCRDKAQTRLFVILHYIVFKIHDFFKGGRQIWVLIVVVVVAVMSI